MKNWAKILGVAALLAVGVAVAAEQGGLYVSGTWRYRMTVEIETPEGIKTGSAVHEVSNASSSVKILSFPESGNPAEFRGEAVMVDLGNRGKLFALINSDSYRELYNAFPVSGPSTVKGIKYYNSLKVGTSAFLPEQAYPQMVTFADMNNPKTVENIPINDLSAVFGKDVKLKEIKVEITDEPVTWDIKKFLPWLLNYYDQRLDGSRYGTIDSQNRFANGLSAGSFSTGEKK